MRHNLSAPDARPRLSEYSANQVLARGTTNVSTCPVEETEAQRDEVTLQAQRRLLQHMTNKGWRQAVH